MPMYSEIKSRIFDNVARHTSVGDFKVQKLRPLERPVRCYTFTLRARTMKLGRTGILIALLSGCRTTIVQLATKDRNHGNDADDDIDTYRPLFVMTISVPSLWNFSQSSLPSSVTLGSSTTPSSSG